MKKPKNIVVMKVGPHGTMNLQQIIKSKQEEESMHGMHFGDIPEYFASLSQPKNFAITIVKLTEKILF